jgi:sigma-B regulation protein RsbU (phosphoserine phosphatase)
LNPTPLKVLAVEDDAVQRRVLVQALKQLDYDVVAATDGENAWKKLQDEPIRLIVSDWMMPGIDGLELCRKIRERPREDYVYFILLTSVDASEANQREAADAGVDDFLTKPLKFNELWMRLRVAGRILGYTRQLQQLEELMPICSYCKKIRDDKNYWQQIEGYINERTGSEFSHSVCPDCYQRVVLPEIEKITKETQHG